MKKQITLIGILVLTLSTFQSGFSQVVKYSDNWHKKGMTLAGDNLEGTVINYSLTEFTFNEILVNGETMKSILIPESFLPNEEGHPDLPGVGKYLALPNGATASYRIISSRTETYYNLEIAPAPRIPLDTEDGPLVYQKNKSIYSTNAFYPSSPVTLSENTQLRGINTVELGIMPFQYNPVTKELIVYKDLVVQVTFHGGNGIVGNNNLRSRHWDQLINSQILNTTIIPSVDYDYHEITDVMAGGCEYLIITPDNAAFLAWADSIKQFRTLQGILTDVVTTSAIGGNTVSAIESYIDNAYNTWTIPPAAVLLLGDYDTNVISTTGITSQLYVHPAGYPNYPSDNKFADVTGDDLPDIVIARITASNATQLSVMVSKFLKYERNPPTKASFYNSPITALGWQTSRWFQLCSEVVGGYLKNVKGKTPIRINALYAGAPETDPWSTASNTSTILNYFGPNGLGYIPATPQQIGGFTGGTATQVINAINSGSFMLMHRDHGSYSGWGEPAFTTSSISLLQNVNNELPFVFSINCQTGAFHRSTESFSEKFHRYSYNGANSGALGLIAATEVSFSYFNDVFLWGVFDNLFPDFLPSTGTFQNTMVRPAFANAAGKYYLSQSNWVGVSQKVITYRLFHHHGDAFMNLYTEVPQALTVSHATTVQPGSTSFSVTANSGSFIALVANGVILGTATGNGTPVTFNFPALNAGTILNVTVTKQNYFRYSVKVPVSTSSGTPVAEFTGVPNSLVSGNSVNFIDNSANNPTSWSWSFPGGTPSSSNAKNPVVTYPTAGSYNVSLTVSNSNGNNTKTKISYIAVNNQAPIAEFTASKTTALTNQLITFTDQSTNSPTSWSWSFPGGTPEYSTQRNPVVSYASPGVYSVTLTASNAAGSSTLTRSAYINISLAPPVAAFTSNITSVLTGETVNFSDISTGNPTSYSWNFPGGVPSTSSLQNPSVTYSINGTFDVSLTVTNAGGSNTKLQSGYITVWNGIITYCSSGSVSAAAEWIAKVTMGTFINSSGATTYSDFTAQEIHLNPGSTVNLSLTPGFAGKFDREYWKIWIDYNSDGDFIDAGENVYTGVSQKNPLSGTVTIPLNASGLTRMRVSMKKLSHPQSCETFERGEVEDYTVNFTSEAFPETNGVQIYPNPTSSILHIKTDTEHSKIFIYGSRGDLLKTLSVNSFDKIDMSEFAPGIYLFRVENNGTSFSKKIIKK